MNVTTITEPEYEPVALQDVYKALRIEPSGILQEHPDDDQLERHIKAARREVEKLTGRALVRQRVRLTTADFCGLHLLRPPLIFVESVSYYDATNQLQTLDSDAWYVTDDLMPELRLEDGAYPSLKNRPDAVRVEYWVGYPIDGSPGDTRADFIANVPPEACEAILLGVQLLYDALTPEQRRDLERARESLLSGLKLQTLV